MKITYKSLITAVTFGILSAATAHAGNSVVLEGFENGFTTNSFGVTNLAAFVNYGTPRGGPVSISLYTSAGPGDPRVTEGTNSAEVVFPADGFGNDMIYALSDTAAALVENAASSNQVARYILRYDVIFEHIDQLAYFNQHFIIANDWDYVRSAGAVITNYNGVSYGIVSFSVPLELTAIGIPIGPLTNSGDFYATGAQGYTALISDQFNGVTEPLNNFTIYMDNVRLVDTYASSATVPTVHPLQSFEDPANPLGGAVDLSGTSVALSSYTTNGLYNPATDGTPDVNTALSDTLVQASDFSVTDGTNSLSAVVNPSYYSYDDFSLPFANSRLQQILSLNLSPAQLANYTLRWDSTLPMVPDSGSDGDYINIDLNTAASILPMSQGRRQSDGQYGLQRVTYSTTLDQITSWGGSPSIAFSFSQPPTWDGATYFFDNFTLINTDPGFTYIMAGNYSPANQQFKLIWLSEPGQTYSVQYSTNLLTGFNLTVATGIASGGDYTTNTVTVPSSPSAGYLRVVGQ
jgi:hypothetical protein